MSNKLRLLGIKIVLFSVTRHNHALICVYPDEKQYISQPWQGLDWNPLYGRAQETKNIELQNMLHIFTYPDVYYTKQPSFSKKNLFNSSYLDSIKKYPVCLSFFCSLTLFYQA